MWSQIVQEHKNNWCSLMKSYLSGSQTKGTIHTPMAAQKNETTRKWKTRPPSLGGITWNAMATIGIYFTTYLLHFICAVIRVTDDKQTQRFVVEKRLTDKTRVCTNKSQRSAYRSDLLKNSFEEISVQEPWETIKPQTFMHNAGRVDAHRRERGRLLEAALSFFLVQRK